MLRRVNVDLKNKLTKILDVFKKKWKIFCKEKYWNKFFFSIFLVVRYVIVVFCF